MSVHFDFIASLSHLTFNIILLIVVDVFISSFLAILLAFKCGVVGIPQGSP